MAIISTGLLGSDPLYGLGGLMGGLANQQAASNANQLRYSNGTIFTDCAAQLTGGNYAKPKKLTMREELQTEIDAWLPTLLETT